MDLQSIALECCVFEADHRPTFKQLITRLSAIIKSLPRDEPTTRPPAKTISTPTVTQQPAVKPAPAPAPAPATGGSPRGGAGVAPKPAPSNPSWNRRGGAADLIANTAPKIQPTKSPNTSKVNMPTTTPSPTAPKVGFAGGGSLNKVNTPTNGSNNKLASPNNSKVSTPVGTSANRGASPNNSKVSLAVSGGAMGNGSGSPGSSKRAKPPPRPMTMYGEQAKNISTIVETSKHTSPSPDHSLAHSLTPLAFSAGPGFYSFEVLKTNPPKDIDKGNLPEYLDPSEFPSVFGMSRDEYFKLPKWKQIAKKSEVGLF